MTETFAITDTLVHLSINSIPKNFNTKLMGAFKKSL